MGAAAGKVRAHSPPKRHATHPRTAPPSLPANSLGSHDYGERSSYFGMLSGGSRSSMDVLLERKESMRDLRCTKLHRGRSLARLVRSYNNRNGGSSDEAAAAAVDSSSEGRTETASDTDGTDFGNDFEQSDASLIYNLYAQWYARVSDGAAQQATETVVAATSSPVTAPTVDASKATKAIANRMKTLMHIRTVPTKVFLHVPDPTKTTPAVLAAAPITTAASVAVHSPAPPSQRYAEPQPREHAVPPSTILCDGDARILMGPAEVYEDRFGVFFLTGDSPFVLEPERTRGMTGRPSPQPDLEGPPLKRDRQGRQTQFVGAMLVARRVPSPDWERVASLGVVQSVRSEREQRKAERAAKATAAPKKRIGVLGNKNK